MSDLSLRELLDLAEHAIDRLDSTIGQRLAVDDQTVADGLYAIAAAIRDASNNIAGGLRDLAEATANSKDPR